MYEDLCLATQPRDMDLKKIGNESGKDRFALEGHMARIIETEYFLEPTWAVIYMYCMQYADFELYFVLENNSQVL